MGKNLYCYLYDFSWLLCSLELPMHQLRLGTIVDMVDMEEAMSDMEVMVDIMDMERGLLML